MKSSARDRLVVVNGDDGAVEGARRDKRDPGLGWTGSGTKEGVGVDADRIDRP